MSFPGCFGKPRKPQWTCAAAIVYHSYHLIQSTCITTLVSLPVHFEFIAFMYHRLN